VTVARPALDGLLAIENARVAVARLRGWSRIGAHENAAKALDVALAALDAADAAVSTVPYAAKALATIHSDLNSLTGGS
jgi:hypothetical protein